LHLLQNVNAASDSIHCPSKVELKVLKRRSGEQARVGTRYAMPPASAKRALRRANGAALCLHAFFWSVLQGPRSLSLLVVCNTLTCSRRQKDVIMLHTYILLRVSTSRRRLLYSSNRAC
jgi:hypothetical protein